MKYSPISFKTDYSLLTSLIKVDDIINYAINNGSNYIGILDDNPYGIMEFYTKCLRNKIKPIIGIKINVGGGDIYLYIENFEGYQNIINIHNLIINNKLTINDVIKYNSGLKCVLPYESYNLYGRFKTSFKCSLGYKSKEELKNASLISKDVLFINEILMFSDKDINILKVLYKIDDKSYEGSNNYILDIDEEDNKTIIDFISDINLNIPFNNRFIPSFTNSYEESKKLLESLAIKGIKKRLNNSVPEVYKNRLKYELSIIDRMGFVDYFLIVFDYVKYAKKSNIYVGPGRGSAAGSLVSYSLGITEIDPIKYDLLFERFLNPDRVTMPDIDIDFEDVKRNEVINYVREKYGDKKVSLITAYATLGSRQVIRDVFKIFKVEEDIINKISKLINPRLKLKNNLDNKGLYEYLDENKLTTYYKVAMKLEGIKKHTSIHAAGVVISSVNISDIVPVYKSSDGIIAGYTPEHLERLGFLKMDFLALRNLTTMHSIIDLIKEKNKDFNIKEISLNDPKTMELFQKADTDDIFQFESVGMKRFLKKLIPKTFDDLVAANALFRPGPMNNIDEYINRKNNNKVFKFPSKDLEEILGSTYGIMIYQEQIMLILSKMAGYSLKEADIIRRAMSKKKRDVIEKEKERFIKESVKNGYTESFSKDIYNQIIKFSEYGFNKSHSVAYAYLGYEIAYLKANFKDIFNLNNVNNNLSGEEKLKLLIEESKQKGYEIIKPNINVSKKEYSLEDNKLILPLTLIKNISASVAEQIFDNKPYEDFIDFFKKNYNKGVNRIVIENLIKAGAMDTFGYSRNTLLENIDSVITYLELVNSLDESLIMKPEIVKSTRLDDELDEKELFGFYISEHPASKARESGMVRIYDSKKYLNKNVKMVGLLDSIKVIDTKTHEKMAFLKISDESGSIEAVIFPKKNYYIDLIKEDDLVSIIARINLRNDVYQAIIDDITVINKLD